MFDEHKTIRIYVQMDFVIFSKISKYELTGKFNEHA